MSVWERTTWVVACNDCGTTDDVGTHLDGEAEQHVGATVGYRPAAWASASAVACGWQATPGPDGDTHLCPDCA